MPRVPPAARAAALAVPPQSRYVGTIARLVRIFSNGEYHEVPPIFTSVFPTAILVFESRFDDTTGEYAPEYDVYRLPPGDERVRGPWAELTKGLTAVGSIPVSDVAVEESERLLEIHTLGIERFVDPALS